MKREIQKLEMRSSGQEAHKTIILPKYNLNEQLNVYEEINPPPNSMYRAVGFNDMERVKIIMQGDDSMKRDLDRKDSLLKAQSSTLVQR